MIGKKNEKKKVEIPSCYEIRNTDKVYCYHLNHLGAPQSMTDGEGNIVWQADYSPFGEAAVTAGDVKNNFRFPGQYLDEETGLHYNWHRYYDPGTGRYLTPDPIGLEGGINLYVYVSNNPNIFSDPSGLYESPWYIKWVPGQSLFDQGMTAAENSDYLLSGAYFTGMLAEQIVFVLSFGQPPLQGGYAGACKGADLVGREINLVDGFYQAEGSAFKFSKYYYEKLWATGRGAPFVQAEEILATAKNITPDRLDGFYRYTNGFMEMVYNPTTKEVWHLMPVK